MTEVALWKPATHDNLRKAGKEIGQINAMILIVAGDGTSYAGTPRSIGPNYVELMNGANLLTVWYSQIRCQFMWIPLPEFGFGVKAPGLFPPS